jgi:hypothetical protein
MHLSPVSLLILFAAYALFPVPEKYKTIVFSPFLLSVQWVCAIKNSITQIGKSFNRIFVFQQAKCFRTGSPFSAGKPASGTAIQKAGRPERDLPFPPAGYAFTILSAQDRSGQSP